MNKQYAYFAELPPRTLFLMHGAQMQKLSDRDGRYVEFDLRVDFDPKELCIVGEYSRLAHDYLEGRT